MLTAGLKLKHLFVFSHFYSFFFFSFAFFCLAHKPFDLLTRLRAEHLLGVLQGKKRRCLQNNKKLTQEVRLKRETFQNVE